jgi:ABC-2 type transport system permease protein
MSASSTSRFAVRVAAIAAKEVLHIRRDPRTLYLAFGMPVVLLLLFGYGVSFDLDRLPLAIADADHSEASRELVDAFTRSREFDVAARASAREAEELFRRGDAVAALVVRPGYARDLARGAPGKAELLVDGADASTANQVLQKADALARAEGQRRARRAGLAAGPPIEARAWTRYNPAARSAIFLVPGLTAYLMALGAVLLTALTVAGEWERGSMEQLFASPVGRFEVILGKLLPYLALGVLQLLLVVAVGSAAFEVPIRGSLALLFLCGLVFLVGMLGQGLLVSVIAKNQLVATQAGVLSSLLPSLLLSGMLFPIENMPRALQVISNAVPARYLVHALRGILLKGSGFSLVWGDVVAMAAFAAAVLAVATARFQRRVA